MTALTKDGMSAFVLHRSKSIETALRVPEGYLILDDAYGIGIHSCIIRKVGGKVAHLKIFFLNVS